MITVLVIVAALFGVNFSASVAYADKDSESNGPTIQTYVNPKLLEQKSVDDVDLDEFEVAEDLWASLRANMDEFREGIQDNFDNNPEYGSNHNRVMSHVLAQDINGLATDVDSAYEGHTFSVSNILPTETRDDFTFSEKAGAAKDLSGENQNSPIAVASEAPEITLSEMQANAIQQAMDAISERAGLGYVFLDLDTGNCISYNIDQPIYGASSFKGPYCAYLCDHLIDEDAYRFSSEVNGPSSDYLFNTLGLNEEELFAGSLPEAVKIAVDTALKDTEEAQQTKERLAGNFANSSGLQSSIEAVVRYSDNDRYRSLRYTYDYSGFAEYLDSIGIDSRTITSQWSFPTYSARNSALLWLNTYHYLFNRDESQTAKWLSDLYATTNLSFVRAGLEQANVPAYVMNKAGWIAGGNVNSTSDAALIEVGNKTYLMSIMTGQPDCVDSEKRVANLACALIEARGALDSRG